MKTKPFDLAAAMRGEPVYASDGHVANFRKLYINYYIFDRDNFTGVYFADFQGKCGESGITLAMLDTTPEAPSGTTPADDLPYRVVDENGKLMATFEIEDAAKAFVREELWPTHKNWMLETDYIASQAPQKRSSLFVVMDKHNRIEIGQSYDFEAAEKVAHHRNRYFTEYAPYKIYPIGEPIEGDGIND
jgi:hypothetical protein